MLINCFILIVAPRLSDPPYNKQAVIAPFSDNNSYRALVINTQNDKAKIVYTDFGNVDDVDIRDLQVLPETLALVGDILIYATKES